MRVLALDLATKTGWAHSCGASGVFDFSVRRDESGGMRLLRLQSKLDEIMNSVGIDLLVFEAARHGAPKMQGALVVQSELQGVVKLWCENQSPRVEYRGYSPAEVKKFATGKGNANKSMVLEAARNRWPDVCVIDDNHADALWLLEMAKEHMGKVGDGRHGVR